MPVKPGKLEKGMTIGLSAPASAPGTAEVIDQGIAVLKKHGYEVKLASNARKRNGFLAGTDADRIADLHELFSDKNVNAIIFLRGGYGTPRILRDLDYDIIRKNPKIMVGFSDITGLHLAIMKKTDLVTFHGPMLTSNIAKEDAPEYTFRTLLKMITEPEPLGSILEGSGIEKGFTITGGKVTAPLTGGNLSLIDTLVGTPWEMESKGKIVFMEEVGEANYRIDRLLTHLLNAGLLQEAAGIVLGQFSDCEIRKSAGEHPTQEMEEIFEERLGNLGIPVAYGFPIGHENLTTTLPMGIKATLDADKGDLIIEEAAVS